SMRSPGARGPRAPLAGRASRSGDPRAAAPPLKSWPGPLPMLRPPKKNPKESSFGHGDGSERHPYHGAARMLGTPARFVAFFHPDYTVGSGISPDLLT